MQIYAWIRLYKYPIAIKRLKSIRKLCKRKAPSDGGEIDNKNGSIQIDIACIDVYMYICIYMI